MRQNRRKKKSRTGREFIATENRKTTGNRRTEGNKKRGKDRERAAEKGKRRTDNRETSE